MKIYMYKGKKNVCGKRVRDLRKERGFTQTTFAVQLQRCNVWLDQKAISRIELEDRVVTDYELWAIATVLKIEIADLLQSMPVIDLEADEREARIAALKQRLADAEAEEDEDEKAAVEAELALLEMEMNQLEGEEGDKEEHNEEEKGEQKSEEQTAAVSEDEN